MNIEPHPQNRQTFRAHAIAQRAFVSLQRFLEVEALSGVVLLVAASFALIWANSPYANSYTTFWEWPLEIKLGPFYVAHSLHFWINDALMTFFLLLVGMEIRREIHEGSLRHLKQACLPLFAALGGVTLPAIFFLTIVQDPSQRVGWAIPTATDIAFALGVLALLGRSIPGSIRVFLLTLAIIDDIIAVLIIALFYSNGLYWGGFLIAGLGLLLVLAFQRIGIGSAFSYLIPGAIVWLGLLMTGAHPSLAGVLLGLLTPVTSTRLNEPPLDLFSRLAHEVIGHGMTTKDERTFTRSLWQLQIAQRELLSPIIRVEKALHPWVAYGCMPLFALANAGVCLDGVDISNHQELTFLIGIMIALIIGKPLGIVSVTWLCVQFKWCKLPHEMRWSGVGLVGLLAGIGFTMSIFISALAFENTEHLNTAKLGVLLGSFISAILGLLWGLVYTRRQQCK